MINREPLTVALIAHDSKKQELVDFVIDNLSFFLSDNLEIISTETTGRMMEQVGLNIIRVNSGPLGGDAQIASRMVEGYCNGLIFFRDPLENHPHASDIDMLLRLCDVHDIPYATNKSSAKLLIEGLGLRLTDKAFNELLYKPKKSS